ncbi:MAG: cysteine desulfurase family protein [Longimicrobiales bacterium]
METRPIYLDHAATTPVRAEVRAAMEPYLSEQFGNPNSAHRWGREARNALEQARHRVAAALGARRTEVFFTGCGTESDNLAVLGRARAARRAGEPDGVVCSAIEHKAVLNAAAAAAAEGSPLTLLAVDPTGHVPLDAVAEALDSRPAVLSVMWGNNEIGTVQPVAEIGELCAEAGVCFHTDAVQALGKTRVRVDEAPCDLLAISGHKIGAPKGVGVLFARAGVDLAPITHGGGQESNVRPGTQNVAGAVGMAVAVELAASEMETEAARLSGLRDELETALRAAVPDLAVNGAGVRLPHVLNVSFPGVDQEMILMALDLEGVAVSGGSACQSGGASPSHVLVALGRPASGEAWLRFSLGHTTTREDVREAAARIPGVVARLRVMAHA